MRELIEITVEKGDFFFLLYFKSIPEFLIFQTTRLAGFEIEYSWDDLRPDRGECVVTIKRVRIPKFSKPSM